MLFRSRHLEKKADRQRTHHLCNMGGAIQSISKEADSLTRVEFCSLMEQVFALPAVQKLVDTAVQNHNAVGFLFQMPFAIFQKLNFVFILFYLQSCSIWKRKPTASARTIFVIWAVSSKAFPKRQTP